MLTAEFFDMGIILFFQWMKTLFIFSAIDRILIGRKFIESLSNHDTYVSSLVVAAFLIIAQAQELSTLSFLFWAFVSMFSYLFLKIILFFLLNNHRN